MAAPESELRLVAQPPLAVIVFGLIFALLPLGLAGLLALRAEEPGVVLLGPLPFVVIGLGMATFRRGAIVDGARATVTRWRGFVGPWFRTSESLAAPTRVRLDRAVRGSGKNRTVVYPVSFEQTGAAALLGEPSDYQVARRWAERAANHLGLGVLDQSGDTTVWREAGTLDQPLAERLRAQGLGMSAPAGAPPRIELLERGDEMVCRLPARGLDLQDLGLAAGAVLMLLFSLLQSVNAGFPVPLLLTVPITFAAAWRIASALWARDLIRFSAAGVAVGRGLVWRSNTRLTAAEIEELLQAGWRSGALGFFGSQSSLILRSDERTVIVARGLAAEEEKWLRDAICHALVGPAQGYRS